MRGSSPRSAIDATRRETPPTTMRYVQTQSNMPNTASSGEAKLPKRGVSRSVIEGMVPPAPMRGSAAAIAR